MEQKFIITSSEGLHARPCTVLVTAATPLQSEVQLTFNDRTVNLKSIMGVMSLGIPSGSEIMISAEGSDAEHAIEVIAATIAKEGIGEKC